MTDTLFVKSKVKEFLSQDELGDEDGGLRVSGDLLDGDKLDTLIEEILEKATYRCKANDRRTVMPQDL